MRTAVIGASNSLVRGGVIQGLIDGGIDVVANGSLGHSQATILPYRLSPTELGSTPFDHLVVEIATNEQIALRMSLANFDMIRSILDWVVRWCAERSVGVTLVTMPELASYKHAGDLRAFQVRHFLSTYAAEVGARCFDGYVWLENHAAQRGLTPERCFETSAHMEAGMSHAFGVHIARIIERPAPALNVPTENPVNYTYVPMNGTGGWDQAQTITRSTSLATAHLLRLTPEQPFGLDLPRGAVVGTVHNASASDAILTVDGATVGAKRYDANPGEKLILTAWGLRNPVSVGGQTTLRARPVEYLPDLEHNHVSVWRPVKRVSNDAPVVELSGLVIASR